MNQSNFDNFDFDHYRKPLDEPGGRSGFISGVTAKFKNPVFATGALLIAGVAFAAIIISSYPDADEVGDVPVIEAETTAFKTLPDERGGMEVPYQDSTVYSSLRDDGTQAETPPVENLLEQEDPVDRLDAFAAEAERIIRESEERQKTLSLIEDATGVEGAGNTAARTQAPAEKPAQVASSADVKKVKQDVEKISPEELMQRVEVPEKPETIHKAGSSPETMEFVKNVLEEENTDAASEVADVEPAAGTAAGVAIEQGTHYIQLGSVKSASGAADEWSKIQDKYSSQLSGLNYRVERADLGDRGVFYRIQAGPISGESANKLCDQIKAQSPGACLVTK